MSGKFSKEKWIAFAKETLQGDDESQLKPDLNKFATLMEKICNKNKGIESVLWKGVNPSGTEDRTWVRTFMCLEGFVAYENMTESLDRAQVLYIVKQFYGVSNV